jgi:hypothetical protein
MDGVDSRAKYAPAADPLHLILKRFVGSWEDSQQFNGQEGALWKLTGVST